MGLVQVQSIAGLGPILTAALPGALLALCIVSIVTTLYGIGRAGRARDM